MKTVTTYCYSLFLVAFRATTVIGGPPAVCLLSPAIQIEAGSASTATIEQGRLCEASLNFPNSDFPPVNFDFHPITCLGLQRAEITVPKEVPNGDAFLLWQCGQETLTCNRAWINGGLNDTTNIVLSQHGNLSCLATAGAITSFSTLYVNPTTITDAPTQTGIAASTTESISTSTAVSFSGGDVTFTEGSSSIVLSIVPGSEWDSATTSSSVSTTSPSSVWTDSHSSSVATATPLSTASTDATSSLFSTSLATSTSCPMSCNNPPTTVT